MKKYKEYPTLTVRVSAEHKKMISELKDKYYINVSKIFRDTVEDIYKRVKNDEIQYPKRTKI